MTLPTTAIFCFHGVRISVKTSLNVVCEKCMIMSDIIEFENLRFSPSLRKWKPAFSKISTLEKKRCVFSDRFHWIRVDAG